MRGSLSRSTIQRHLHEWKWRQESTQHNKMQTTGYIQEQEGLVSFSRKIPKNLVWWDVVSCTSRVQGTVPGEIGQHSWFFIICLTSCSSCWGLGRSSMDWERTAEQSWAEQERAPEQNWAVSSGQCVNKRHLKVQLRTLCMHVCCAMVS